MKLIWSPEARQQLFSIFDHIFEDNQQNALSVFDRLEQYAENLIDHPRMGREGRKPGTRELLHGKLPFFLVYRIKEDEIQILEVRHYKQLYP